VHRATLAGRSDLANAAVNVVLGQDCRFQTG